MVPMDDFDAVFGETQIGADVTETAMTKVMNLILGIPAQTISAGTTADVIVNVSRPFRVRRLVLSAAAQALTINDIKVSNVSEFINSNPVAGEVFAADAVGVGLQGNTAQPGVGVELAVFNSTLADIVIAGALFGEAALPS